MAAELPERKPLTTEEIRPLFRELAAKWKRETGYYSFTHQIAAHPAYLQIVEMGPTALPLILEDLRDDGGFWFMALSAITGANPYPPEFDGAFAKIDVQKTAEAWLEWGRRNQLI